MDVYEHLRGAYAPGRNGVGAVNVRAFFKDEDYIKNHKLYPQTVNHLQMRAFFDYVWTTLKLGKTAGKQSSCLLKKFKDLAWMLTELTPADVGHKIFSR